MEVLRTLARVWILWLVLLIHTMLAGGLAVTLHSMVTVSSLAGELLLPRSTILLRGTVTGEYEN